MITKNSVLLFMNTGYIFTGIMTSILAKPNPFREWLIAQLIGIVILDGLVLSIFYVISILYKRKNK